MGGRWFQRFQTIWLGVVALLGLAGLLVTGWHLLFAKAGAKPPTTLLVVGALLAASPFLISRLDTIAFGAKGFELKLTQQIADLGAPKTAALLDHTELGRLVESYGIVREELGAKQYKNARIHVQDTMVSRAATFATQHEFDPNEVRKLFPRAAPVVRVMLIGLMKGDPRLLDAAVIASAIQAAATPNERYHALDVASWHWTRFTAPEQAAILVSVSAAGSQIDNDQRLLANKILALGASSAVAAPSLRRRLLRRLWP